MPTRQTEDRSTPHSPPIGPFPASRSAGSGPSFSSSALSWHKCKTCLSQIGFHQTSDIRSVRLDRRDIGDRSFLVFRVFRRCEIIIVFML